jgi:glycosyltransferase involved in cell wall biosynthesis
VVVTHNLNLEGAPKAILEATRTLVREGRIVATVISPMEGPLRAEYEAAGVAVEVVVIPSPNNQDISTHERGLVALGKLFHRHQADVVLANTLETFTAIDAAHSVGIPSVWVIHESEGWQDYFRYLPPEVERRALACFGHPYRVVFVSHATRRIYAELDYHHNATVIPGGLDRTALEPFLGDGPRDRFRLELGLKEGDLALLLVGTVCERKGQIDIAGALARIDPATLAEMPQVFIVGDRDSTYSRELHAAISSLPPAWRAKIHVVVETPDVWPYYAAADLFVCPSRMESYPRVILEAMAFGLPIITTPVHGIVEQVRAGINGEFFVPGDVAALARLIREFLDDPVRRARYGANAVEVLRGLNTQVESARILGQALLEAAGSGIAPSRLEQIRPA